MIKLEKITLQGFKSFKRPTSIVFPANFVVITGPNGSGKSNLADGVIFVLGKASSKYLRAKKASDLIFHGSKKKPPSDYAKVSLVFSNEKKILPVDGEKITVARRLNKDGVSTYKLNGKITTRQQILDIFMQARINPGGHNIILQGDVAKIIEMNPLERREIIDEISGIKEYDEKKMQALKELEKVAEKVREAEIILEQKEEIIEKLKKERDVALEYQSLQNELEAIKAAIIWKEFSSVQKNMGNIGKHIEEKETEVKTLQRKVEEIDKKMAEKEDELENLMKDVMKASDQIEIMKKISKIESSIDSKESMIKANEREIQRLEELINNMLNMDRKVKPELEPILNMKGVHGFVKDLIIVPNEYKVAVDVAGGNHLNDIVVDNIQTTVTCIKYLKENKIGRARFLPMDKIRPSPKQELPEGTLGWLSELVHHDVKYTSIIEYILGRTACVHDIDKAKKIADKHRIRLVTLDGDLFEPSGAVTGGYYTKSKMSPEIKRYREEREKLEEENRLLKLEIEELEEQLKKLNKEVRVFKSFDIEKKRGEIKHELEKLGSERKKVYEKMLTLQEEVNKLKINRAKHEANFDNLKIQWDSLKKEWDKVKNKEFYEKRGIHWLKERQKEILTRISELGHVNMKAIEEFEILKEEFEEFRERVEKITQEKDSIIKSITEIENKKREVFMTTLNEMSKIFKEIYNELTGGEGSLGLEDPEDLNSGLLISAQPPGKKLRYIDVLSGGERVMAALSFLFTIQRYKPSPFYVLDEIDAALDKVNTRKVIDLIKKQSKDVQFIIISHNTEMVKAADVVYGVSMEDGESKIIGIKMPEK
ncbi:MAG: chromosome segregation protein SMC [Candidatus Aenigmarchaeota archaeon]|nr:chromosome segregation protein SMC [Candidatus Aenigmarchaeota archaeon]